MITEPKEVDHTSGQLADRVKIVYYTDPLCCWSWAFEPHWQRLLSAFGGQISYSYCMGGLIPDWDKFSDPMNSVSRPIQMGPVWLEVKHLTGCKINEAIWMLDPPSSSYPACIAVKTAGLQSRPAEELYLLALRKAVMTKGRNIAQTDILYDIGVDISRQHPEVFSVEQFASDFNGEASRQAFREDLAKIRYNRIGRFPSLTFTRQDGTGLMITGYRPYEALLEAFKQMLKKEEPAERE